MSIFDTIKNAIFHRAEHAAPAQTRTAQANPQAAPRPAASGAPASNAAPAATAPKAPPTAAQAVDIEPVLDSLASKKSEKLNWRSSIVDLMKLVDLDSSITNRKELAKELGYTGDTADSAAMNIWLHKQVMTKLAQNGGKVPGELLH